MIYDDIRNFLGQQNFALTATANPEITVLRNQGNGCEIFCALIDNTRKVWGPSQIQALNEKLLNFNGTYNDVLFLVVTDDVERDKQLSQLYRVRLWLVDELQGRLLVYENQPEDFYGLRLGIAETAAREIYPDEGLRKGFKSKNRFLNKINSMPYVTAALIIVNVAYFAFTAAGGSLSSSAYMLRMGANYGVYVFEKGQIWRLLTSMFLHFSFSHLAGNMFYLGVAGYNVEKAAGHLKFFLIYMLSGFGAGLVSAGYYYLTGAGTISAGASGAVYGLIGAMVIITYKNRGRIRSPQMFLRIGIILLFLYYSNFTDDGVDWPAHIAGFVFGVILSFIFIGAGKNKKYRSG